MSKSPVKRMETVIRKISRKHCATKNTHMKRTYYAAAHLLPCTRHFLAILRSTYIYPEFLLSLNSYVASFYKKCIHGRYSTFERNEKFLAASSFVFCITLFAGDELFFYKFSFPQRNNEKFDHFFGFLLLQLNLVSIVCICKNGSNSHSWWNQEKKIEKKKAITGDLKNEKIGKRCREYSLHLNYPSFNIL